MSEDFPQDANLVPQDGAEVAAAAAGIAADRLADVNPPAPAGEIIPIPFKPSHGAEKTHGYGVDADFDKQNFDAQYGRPTQESFAGVSLDEAKWQQKSKDNPNLVQTPKEIADAMRPGIMQDIQDRQQEAAKSRENFTGISNAPSHHRPIGGPRPGGDTGPRLVNS